jgi:hypothetical protein
VTQECTHPWACYETDEYVEDKDFTIFTNSLNKANLAYQVLFAEKLDKRFLHYASTWCACDAYRIQLRHQLQERAIALAPRELTPRLCEWLEGRFRGDILKERLTQASIESCTPAFLMVLGDESPQQCIAKYAPEIVHRVQTEARMQTDSQRCKLEHVDYEIEQLCGFSLIKHFVLFESTPERTMQKMQKLTRKANARSPPVIICMLDGGGYVAELSTHLYTLHETCMDAVARWLELTEGEKLLGVWTTRMLFDNLKK